MRVCFYSPYIPKHFGGGERHLFDIASLVATKHEVSIAINRNEEKSLDEVRAEYQKFLNYSIEGINFVHSPIPSGTFLEKLIWMKQFDYLYYATDGSLFFNTAKKGNLHIQIPFVEGKSLLDRLKLSTWNIKNTNSAFTKKVVESKWHTKVDFVHHPRVNLEEFSAKAKKEKIILNVGRFFKQLHCKRQDVLVEVFKELVDQHPKLMKGWKLYLVGAVEDQTYFDQVKEMANGYPVEFYPDINRKTLVEYFEKSKIYWHATGFDVDEEVEPEKVEHFGITTIEAMAAGCVPVVIGKGGQVEILGKELEDLLWISKDQCIEKTIKVMSPDFKYDEFLKIILERVEKFDQNSFAKTVWQMFV